jgi:hypothetical protein
MSYPLDGPKHPTLLDSLVALIEPLGLREVWRQLGEAAWPLMPDEAGSADQAARLFLARDTTADHLLTNGFGNLGRPDTPLQRALAEASELQRELEQHLAAAGRDGRLTFNSVSERTFAVRRSKPEHFNAPLVFDWRAGEIRLGQAPALTGAALVPGVNMTGRTRGRPKGSAPQRDRAEAIVRKLEPGQRITKDMAQGVSVSTLRRAAPSAKKS